MGGRAAACVCVLLCVLLLSCVGVASSGASGPGDDSWPLEGEGAVLLHANGSLLITSPANGSVVVNGRDLAAENAILARSLAAVRRTVATLGIKQWTRQFGTNETDIARDVATAPDGSVLVAGATAGRLDGNENLGGSDIFVSKFSNTGAWLWTRQMGGAGTDAAIGVACDRLGSVYVVGMTTGVVNGYTGFNVGGQDAFLLKLSSTGVTEWVRQLGSRGEDVAIGVAVDACDAVYVTGHTTDGFDGNLNAGQKDIVLAKFNSTGGKEWLRQIGGGGDDRGFSVATSGDGSCGVYVAGDTTGSLASDGSTGAGGYDMFLGKYNASGGEEWVRQLGSGGNDAGRGVAADGDGGVYVAGYTTSDLDNNTYLGGEYDGFVAKYDAEGRKKWTRQFGTAGVDACYAAASDSAGNIFAGCHTTSSAGSADVLVYAYNSDGQELWTRQLGSQQVGDGGEGHEYGYGVACDTEGSVFVAGATTGWLGTDSKTKGRVHYGAEDVYLAKFGLP